MKKGIFLISVAFAALLTGCSDEFENRRAQNPVQTGEEVLFGTSLSDEGQTRTVYGDRDKEGVPVNWVDGDEIAIFCKETSAPANHLVNYKITANPDKPSQASEVMKVDPNAAGLQWGEEKIHNFYAFYPASAVHAADADDQQGTITANIPVNQQPAGWRTGPIVSEDQTVNGATTIFALPNMNYAYMYAYNAVDKNTVESGSGTIWLQFHNLVTVLDITIPAPEDGSIVKVTDVTVRAVDGSNTVLTGDFNCYIRGAGDNTYPECQPVGDMGQVRNVVNISCYDQEKGQYVELGGDIKFLNVKAYIIPDNVHEPIDKRTLQIAVNTLNGGEKKRTLGQASIVPHKINRVLLPAVVPGGTNYWMSNLDPNIYVSELSIPGSKFSVLTKGNGASRVYQNATIEQQLEDGVRGFIFQTSDIFYGLGSSFRVVCEDKNNPLMSLGDAIKPIAEYLQKCQENGKTNEFAFVMLTYSGGGHLLNDEGQWINGLREEVNKLSPDYRIYTEEVTANTTIDDVKGKIILKANYNSENMVNSFSGSAPIMFTYWQGPYGPRINEKDPNSDYYQDLNGGMPMDWGKPVWYLNSLTPNLRWYYQEVTSVGSGQEATRAEKETFITNLFTKSVDLYKNDNAHKTWFMNDLGGYYSDNGDINNRGTGIEALAIDMNNLGVDQLQKRTENAGLGLIFMNFADKQAESGAKYKSDMLIQTIIMNNRKFQLRKKGDSSTGTKTVTRTVSDENVWDK